MSVISVRARVRVRVHVRVRVRVGVRVRECRTWREHGELRDARTEERALGAAHAQRALEVVAPVAPRVSHRVARRTDVRPEARSLLEVETCGPLAVGRPLVLGPLEIEDVHARRAIHRMGQARRRTACLSSAFSLRTAPRAPKNATNPEVSGRHAIFFYKINKIQYCIQYTIYNRERGEYDTMRRVVRDLALRTQPAVEAL